MATEQYQIVPVQPSCNIVPVSNKCMYNVKPLVSDMRTPQKKKEIKITSSRNALRFHSIVIILS